MATTSNETPARKSTLREIFRSRSMQRHNRFKTGTQKNNLDPSDKSVVKQNPENRCPLPVVCVEYDLEVEDCKIYRVRSFKRTSKGLISLGDSLRASSTTNCSQNYDAALNDQGLKDRQSFLIGKQDTAELVVKCSSGGASVFMKPSNSPLSLPNNQHDIDRLLAINQNTADADFQNPSQHLISSSSSSTFSITEPIKVQLLGGPTVGKTTLCRQFVTSEFMGARTESFSEENVERFVIVEVDGWNRSLMLIDNVREEASLLSGNSITTTTSTTTTQFFLDHERQFHRHRALSSNIITVHRPSAVNINAERKISCNIHNREPSISMEIDMQIVKADVYVVVYAVDDENSFKIAKNVINKLLSSRKPEELMLIYLVGNKTDLVRKRQVSNHRGAQLAVRSKAVFFEISTAINHLVDELLVDIVVQWRKQTTTQECHRLGLPLPQNHPEDYYLSACHDQGRKSWVANLSNPKNVLQRIFKQQFTAKSCIDLQNS